MATTGFGLLVMLAISAPPSPPGKVAVLRADEATHFYVDGELAATYHHGPNAAKPYFWPLNAPGAVPLTRSAEETHSDRPFQSSAWFGHGDVLPVGVDISPKRKDIKGVDFWTHQPSHGVIQCTSVGVTENVPGRAEARTTNVWKLADGRPVIDEIRHIELYNLGDARLLIVTCSLKPAGIPVTFGDSCEGGFAIRVSDQLRGGLRQVKHRMNNSLGQFGELNDSKQRIDWCDISGVVNDQQVGIAIFEDPANKPRASWSAQSYGLLNANPFARAESPVRLKPGEQLTLRYGLLLHSGDATTIAASYRKFLAVLQ